MRVQRIAEVAGTDGSVADLAEVRTAMPRDGSESSPAAMPAADMRMTEAMTTEMTAAVMSTTVTAAMTTTVATTAMTAAVATAALCQRRTCQQASQGHCGNSSDGSQHLTLPQIHTGETPERVGFGTGQSAESSRAGRRTRQGG